MANSPKNNGEQPPKTDEQLREQEKRQARVETAVQAGAVVAGGSIGLVLGSVGPGVALAGIGAGLAHARGAELLKKQIERIPPEHRTEFQVSLLEQIKVGFTGEVESLHSEEISKLSKKSRDRVHAAQLVRDIEKKSPTEKLELIEKYANQPGAELATYELTKGMQALYEERAIVEENLARGYDPELAHEQGEYLKEVKARMERAEAGALNEDDKIELGLEAQGKAVGELNAAVGAIQGNAGKAAELLRREQETAWAAQANGFGGFKKLHEEIKARVGEKETFAGKASAAWQELDNAYQQLTTHGVVEGVASIGRGYAEQIRLTFSKGEQRRRQREVAEQVIKNAAEDLKLADKAEKQHELEDVFAGRYSNMILGLGEQSIQLIDMNDQSHIAALAYASVDRQIAISNETILKYHTDFGELLETEEAITEKSVKPEPEDVLNEIRNSSDLEHIRVYRAHQSYEQYREALSGLAPQSGRREKKAPAGKILEEQQKTLETQRDQAQQYIRDRETEFQAKKQELLRKKRGRNPQVRESEVLSHMDQKYQKVWREFHDVQSEIDVVTKANSELQAGNSEKAFGIISDRAEKLVADEQKFQKLFKEAELKLTADKKITKPEILADMPAEYHQALEMKQKAVAMKEKLLEMALRAGGNTAAMTIENDEEGRVVLDAVQMEIGYLTDARRKAKEIARAEAIDEQNTDQRVWLNEKLLELQTATPREVDRILAEMTGHLGQAEEEIVKEQEKRQPESLKKMGRLRKLKQEHLDKSVGYSQLAEVADLTAAEYEVIINKAYGEDFLEKVQLEAEAQKEAIKAYELTSELAESIAGKEGDKAKGLQGDLLKMAHEEQERVGQLSNVTEQQLGDFVERMMGQFGVTNLDREEALDMAKEVRRTAESSGSFLAFVVLLIRELLAMQKR